MKKGGYLVEIDDALENAFLKEEGNQLGGGNTLIV